MNPIFLLASLWMMGLARAQETQTTSESPPTVQSVSGEARCWKAIRQKVERITGKVSVEPTDRLGTPQGEPATIEAEAVALITLKGVRVGKDNGLSIARDPKGLTLKLFDGKLLVQSFGAPIVTETLHGKAHSQGGCYLVEVTEKSTRIISIEGKVSLTNSLGTVALESGEESVMYAAKPPTPPKPGRPGDEWAGQGVPNLLRNPGFERGFASWTLRVAQPAKDLKTFATIALTGAYSGSACAQIVQRVETEKESWEPVPLFYPLTLTRGKRYLARCFLRIEARQGTVDVKVNLNDNTNQEGNYSPSVVQDRRWHMIHVPFTAKSADGYQWNLCLHRSEGKVVDITVWADEFSLTPLPDE